MKGRVLALGCIFAGIVVTPSWAQDWEMSQKDQFHSGSIEQGPRPPLKRAWVAKSEESSTYTSAWPVVSQGTVFATHGPGQVAVEASSGKIHWFVENEEEGATQIAPTVDENRLYLSIPFSRFIALDRATGNEVWRFQAKDSLDASSVLAEGRIYVGSAEAKTFYSLEAATGNLIWEKVLDLEPNSVPLVADGLVVFSVHTLDSDKTEFIALDAETGNEVWRVPNTVSNSSASVLDQTVIFGGGDFFAYALDLRTGRQVWKSSMEDKFGIRSMPAIAFGDVFLADRIGNIYRLDGKTGKRKWIFSDTEGTFDQSSPVVAGKTLYIGSGAGFLYGVDVDTGKLVWRDRVRGIVLSGAADAERFYFGVKFGDEGLYAYAHDPDPARTDIGGPRAPGLVTTMFKAFALFLVILLVLVLYVGYRKRRRAA